MQDIHDIRPPVQVGMDPAFLKAALIAIVLVLLAVAAIFALRYFRRKSSAIKLNLPMLPPPPPPLEAALNELNRLDYLMIENPRLFYFRLTEIIKRFLGKMFVIKALEMNTQELIPALKGFVEVDREMFADMREFLLFSDRIKYAGEIQVPPSSVMNVHLSFVRTFVTLINERLVNQRLVDQGVIDQGVVNQKEEEKGDGKVGKKERHKKREGEGQKHV